MIGWRRTRKGRGAAWALGGLLVLLEGVSRASEPDPVPVTPEQALEASPPVEVGAAPAAEADEKSRKRKNRTAEQIDVVDRPLDPARVAGSAQALDQLALEAYEYEDVHRVLRQVPGVYLREEDGFGLRPNIGLRGASSDRSSKVTLMEDGVLFAPAPYSAPAAYYFPLMTRVVGLEVYKGPAAVRFGPNTVGGAINLLTAPIPERTRGELELFAGQYRFGRLHGRWGTSGRHAGLLLEASHVRTDGFKALDGGGGTGFDRTELMLKGRLNTAPEGRLYQQLELKLGYADERSDETYLGLTDEDFEATPYRRYAASQRDRMELHRTQLQLSHLLRLGYQLEVRTTFYRHDLSRAWTKLNRFRDGPALVDILANPNAGQSAVFLAILRGELDSEGTEQALMVGTNARDYVSQGLQSVAWWQSGGARWSHRLELGVRLHYDRIDRMHTEDAFQMRSGVLVPEGGETLVTARNRGESRALAVHASEELAFGELLVTPGVRLEAISSRLEDSLAEATLENRDLVVLPGLGVLYRVVPAVSLLAGVHRGFSPVSPGQDDAVAPELSVNYEAGGRLELGDTRAELVGFFNDYRNLTGECTFSSGCPDEMLNQQFNAGAVHVYGLEAFAGQAVALGRGIELRADLAYTLTLSRFLTGFTSIEPAFGEVEPGDQLPHIPVHQGALRLAVSGGRFGVNLSASRVGAMREKAGQGEIDVRELIPAQTVVDLSGRYRVGRRTEILLRIDNLLGSDSLVSRLPYGARPGKPFWVQAGLRIDFDDPA